MEFDIQNCLITGASRGIGLVLAQTLILSGKNCTVIACARNTNSLDLSKDENLEVSVRQRFVTAKVDSTSETDARNIMEHLKQAYKIVKLDLVIANAGDASSYMTVLGTMTSDMLQTFENNTLGPLRLFQATLPLLHASDYPKFILISSSLGSIGLMEHETSPALAYGCSKVAANFLSKVIHCEHQNFVSIAIHPGWVKTSMGQKFAESVGVSEPSLDIKESVLGILRQISIATRVTTSGSFITYDGRTLP